MEPFICQSKLSKYAIKKFGLKDAKSFGTPMSSICVLTSDEKGKPIDETKYRDMIGYSFILLLADQIFFL